MPIPVQLLVISAAAALILASTHTVQAQDDAVITDTNAMTQVVFQTNEDDQGRVYLNPDGLSRIEVDKHNAYYLLFDHQKPNLWMLDMGREVRTDAYELMFTGSGVPYYIDARGAGEVVAGMETRRFEVSNRNGDVCASYHLAENAWRNEPDLAPLETLISAFAINPGRVVPALGPLAAGFINPCLRAELDALPELAEYGMPLMRVNQDQEVAFEVTAIEKIGSIDDCLLTLPEHYTPRTPAEVAMESLKDSLFRRSGPDTDHIELTDCP